MFINGNMPGLLPVQHAGIFDGIDIDWEYPAFPRTDGQSKGGYVDSPNDTQNYTAMLAEFRKQLGNNHLLTIAAPAGQDKYSKIQLSKISQYVNWINLMTFDYHGSWDTHTDIQAPLYCNPKDPSPGIEKTYCIDDSINGYLKAGVPASKINLGIPFYGHGWTMSRVSITVYFRVVRKPHRVYIQMHQELMIIRYLRNWRARAIYHIVIASQRDFGFSTAQHCEATMIHKRSLPK